MDHTDERTSLREGFFAHCLVEPPVRPPHEGVLPSPVGGATETAIAYGIQEYKTKTRLQRFA